MPTDPSARALALAVLLPVLCAAPAAAQQRPLLTEDPESIGSGMIMLEGGFEYTWEQPYPVSGLRGHRLRAPILGVSFGVSSIAEVQIDGISYQRLRVLERGRGPLSALVNVTGDAAQDMEDLVVGTKVRLIPETDVSPSFALRFATRLPNAGNESGLGVDSMAFFNTLLVGKSIGPARILANVGLGILSDPLRGDRQNDVVMYGVSVARALNPFTEVVAEVNGHANTRRGTPPPGTDTSGHLRAGVRYRLGPLRIDGAVISGLTSRDGKFGVTAGLTWIFPGLPVPVS